MRQLHWRFCCLRRSHGSNSPRGGEVRCTRPPHRVMISNKFPTPPLHLATPPRQATLRPHWWTITKKRRLEMHAFTRSSHHLKLKVRAALLRSLRQTSLRMRLILKAKSQGARTKRVGKALHIRLESNHWEGTALLKFIYGYLYNGNQACQAIQPHPYGRMHTPTSPKLLHTHCGIMPGPRRSPD